MYEGEKEVPNYEKHGDPEHKFTEVNQGYSPSIKTGDSTHRQLKPRHIQLIGIGGTIGTALYVQIGHGLINGGPGSLFLAFTIWYVYFILFCFFVQGCMARLREGASAEKPREPGMPCHVLIARD